MSFDRCLNIPNYLSSAYKYLGVVDKNWLTMDRPQAKFEVLPGGVTCQSTQKMKYLSG